MKSKYVKTIVFASLIAAMIIPFSGIMNVDAQTTDTNMIQKPELSAVQKSHIAKITALVKEQEKLMSDGSELREKYQRDSTSVSPAELQLLTNIQERLNEIKGEFGIINVESVALHAIDAQELNTLVSAQKTLIASDIPVTHNGVDQRIGALYIGFDTQDEADKYTQALEDLLDVPFYLEIGLIEENYTCTNRSDDCNPLMGGIQIVTQARVSPLAYGDCSYSIPAVRNVFWWTETGFVTAGHCFAEQNGNDVWQPTESDGKIGDLTLRVYTHNGECDCAFVQKSGTESTLFGNWWGTGVSNQLLSRSDPLVGSYVWTIGAQSPIDWGYVSSNTHTSTVDGVSILNTLRLDSAANGLGDSGGTVIDMSTTNVYHGLIKSGVGTSYTVAVPWSHIDNGLNLQ